MLRIHQAIGLGLCLALTSAAHAVTSVSGDLYFTNYDTDERVIRQPFVFDGTTLTLGSYTVVAYMGANAMAGADGIAFDPNNGHILVGAQTSTVHRFPDPVVGPVSSTSTGGPAAFHLAVDPNGLYVWASGIPGGLSRVPIGGAFGTAGTPFTILGSTTAITQLLFVPDGLGGYKNYYTNASPVGSGQFGTLTFAGTTATTSLLFLDPGAHGGTYDPFTGHILIFGDTRITQIDPVTDTIVSFIDISGADFDQGTVNGLGHIFVASNNGDMTFIDYSATGLVGAGAGNFFSTQFVHTALDDVAPQVGPGAPPPTTGIPEPLTAGTSLLALATLLLRRHR